MENRVDQLVHADLPVGRDALLEHVPLDQQRLTAWPICRNGAVTADGTGIVPYAGMTLVRALSDTTGFSAPAGRRGAVLQFCRLMMSAARSAMARTVALVFAPGREGITDASTTRSWSIPRTRSCRSVTAEASVPILQVPTGWK
jgi:hypothetical protein